MKKIIKIGFVLLLVLSLFLLVGCNDKKVIEEGIYRGGYSMTDSEFQEYYSEEIRIQEELLKEKLNTNYCECKWDGYEGFNLRCFCYLGNDIDEYFCNNWVQNNETKSVCKGGKVRILKW